VIHLLNFFVWYIRLYIFLYPFSVSRHHITSTATTTTFPHFIKNVATFSFHSLFIVFFLFSSSSSKRAHHPDSRLENQQKKPENKNCCFPEKKKCRKKKREKKEKAVHLLSLLLALFSLPQLNSTQVVVVVASFFLSF